VSSIRATAAALVGALALAQPAAARTAAAPVLQKPWATVNVCNTQGQPDAFGVRGSMPGTGIQRTHLYLRIQVQFQKAPGQWKDLGRSGDSGWVDAGKTKVHPRQAGRTFTIVPPRKGQPPFVLRARVAFEWRRGKAVLKRAETVTTAGHRSAAGGDPRGFSAATCTIA
jgi:hypothetical protein